MIWSQAVVLNWRSNKRHPIVCQHRRGGGGSSSGGSSSGSSTCGLPVPKLYPGCRILAPMFPSIVAVL